MRILFFCLYTWQTIRVWADDFVASIVATWVTSVDQLKVNIIHPENRTPTFGQMHVFICVLWRSRWNAIFCSAFITKLAQNQSEDVRNKANNNDYTGTEYLPISVRALWGCPSHSLERLPSLYSPLLGRRRACTKIMKFTNNWEIP